jgi:hypothetical protein
MWDGEWPCRRDNSFKMPKRWREETEGGLLKEHTTEKMVQRGLGFVPPGSLGRK